MVAYNKIIQPIFFNLLMKTDMMKRKIKDINDSNIYLKIDKLKPKDEQFQIYL
jgi:hypothetical protein